MHATEALEVLARRALTREESARSFRKLLAGGYSELEMAALLVALKTRGETPEVMAGVVEALLESLSPDQRDVLLLRVIADLSVAETAQTLGKGEEAVKQLQRRALASLRRRISSPGPVPQ